MSGGDTLTISGSSGNTYTGATTISDGRVKLAKTSGYAIPGDFTWSTIPRMSSSRIPTNSRRRLMWRFGSGNPHLEVYGNTVTVGGINLRRRRDREHRGGNRRGQRNARRQQLRELFVQRHIRDNAGGSGTSCRSRRAARPL